MITIETLKNNAEVQTLLRAADKQLQAMGYTEHSMRHVNLTASRAKEILLKTGRPRREAELAEIAAYLHDVGNAVNRVDHPHSGAIMAYQVLTKLGMSFDEAAEVMLAIGNHDEGSGVAVSNVSAALIIADKSDVNRSRVRDDKILPDKTLKDYTDIHDRVNFAVTGNDFFVDEEHKEILLKLTVNTEICSAMDYFEIFLQRMRMCIGAAKYLDHAFKLEINGYSLL